MDSLDFINDTRLRVDTNTVVFHSISELSTNHKADELIRRLSKFDESTYIHCYNVAKLSVAIGIRLNFNTEDLQDLFKAGLFHDVGKMGIGIAIINKKGKLTKDEYIKMQRHSFIGYSLLKGLGFSKAVYTGVLEHQEKWSGLGYPEGKKGESISLFGRILAIADVFDALTSERPYHNAMTPKEAITYMWSTNDFDRQILKKFIEIVNLENQMVV